MNYPQQQGMELRRGSSFFPSSTSVLPNNTRMNPTPISSYKDNTLRRMNSDEAMSLALMLSEQESRHGINMYDSLQSADEPEIMELMNRGMSMESAVLEVFNRKVKSGTVRNSGGNNNVLSNNTTVPQNSWSGSNSGYGYGNSSVSSNSSIASSIDANGPYSHMVRPGDRNYNVRMYTSFSVNSVLLMTNS